MVGPAVAPRPTATTAGRLTGRSGAAGRLCGDARAAPAATRSAMCVSGEECVSVGGAPLALELFERVDCGNCGGERPCSGVTITAPQQPRCGVLQLVGSSGQLAERCREPDRLEGVGRQRDRPHHRVSGEVATAAVVGDPDAQRAALNGRVAVKALPGTVTTSGSGSRCLPTPYGSKRWTSGCAEGCGPCAGSSGTGHEPVSVSFVLSACRRT